VLSAHALQNCPKIKHAVHSRVIGMPELLAQTRTLLQDGNLFRSPRQGSCGYRQFRIPRDLAHSAVGEAAGRRVEVANLKIAVANDTQAARPVGIMLLAMATQGRRNSNGLFLCLPETACSKGLVSDLDNHGVRPESK
jgi:hypothetical protein